MKTSEKGKQFIKNYESLELKAYQCETQKRRNKGEYTIGYGWTGNVEGKPINENTVITKEQAEKYFDSAIVSRETTLNKLIKVPLKQNQYDAVVSLTYNTGMGAFGDSILLKVINDKNFNDVPQEITRWNHIDTNVTSEGLTKRRVRECCMFVFGEYKVN